MNDHDAEPRDRAVDTGQWRSPLAGVLTSAPELQRVAQAYDGVDHRETKRVRALTMLADLEAFGRSLLTRVDLGDPLTAEVSAAASDGDYEHLDTLGIDLDYAWLDDVIAAVVNDAGPVEFDTLGPYGHRRAPAPFAPGNLSPAETTGLLLGAAIRAMSRTCDNVRMVAMVGDRFDADGGPLTGARRQEYLSVMTSTLRDHGVLLADDVPERHYVLLRESEQVARIAELVNRLEGCGQGEVVRSASGDVVFQPSPVFVEKLALNSAAHRREFRDRGIDLIRDGRPTDHAVDAASFLGDANTGIVHVVAVDRVLRIGQDRTYALIRALDLVTQDRYHNLFFDVEKIEPELLAYAMTMVFQNELRSYLRLLAFFDDWERFDPHEYVGRHYGRMLTADRAIVEFVVDQLAAAGLAPASLAAAADVGAGPNLYPSMLMAPYVRDDGRIDLIEYTDVNRRYLTGALRDTAPTWPWDSFEALMRDRGGDRYAGALDMVRRTGDVRGGSIFALPPERYDLAASYFVAESITVSRSEFRAAIRSLASCLRRDGLLTAAHMLGSQGWFAGRGTNFPAVVLTVDDVAEAYRDADLTFAHRAVGEGAEDTARDGYEGMVVLVARRYR